MNPKPSIERSTQAGTAVREPSPSLPSFPLRCIIEAMSERWDDLAAEDLVSGYLADLSDSSRSRLPLNREGAAEANRTIADALAMRDARLLERGLLDVRDAWNMESESGYLPPEDWWNDE